jgi:transposase
MSASALDVHKAQVAACVRVPDADGAREPQLAEFSTTVAGLMALRDWLAAYRVTHVAMEATGVYWQPVWHIPEDDFELTPCNARHVKQPRSRISSALSPRAYSSRAPSPASPAGPLR